MKVTFFSSLFDCDKFIDNYINNLKNLINFSEHNLIITNIVNSNSLETNNKINNFANLKNIKVINLTKKEDPGLYKCWNNMIEIADTELVCNINPDDKIMPEFLDLIEEFKLDNDLSLVCTPLKIFNENNIFLGYWHHFKQVMISSSNTSIDTYKYKLEQFKKIFTIEKSINIPKFKLIKFTYFDIFDMFHFISCDKNHIGKAEGYRAVCLPGCVPIWKKELFNKYGGFNENEFNESADYELWCRYLSKKVKMKSVDKHMVDYLFRENSVGNNKKNNRIVEKIFNLYHPCINI